MKKTIYVQNMHCGACESVVRMVAKEHGVQCVQVAHRSGKLVLEGSESAIQKTLGVLEKKGYPEVSSPQKVSWGRSQLASQYKFSLLVWLCIIVLFRWMGEQLGVQESLMRSIGGTGYLTAVLTGLVASVSSCLAVTGGIVIGFGRYVDDTKGMGKHARIQTQFHIGRILGFFVFGALLGRIGQALHISLTVTSILSMIVALLMIYLSVYMLGLVPSLQYRGIGIPAKRSSHLHTHRHPWLAPLIGALTFLIPCGFTQSMQLIALASGDPRVGGITLALFALGTMPVLFGIGLGASWTKNRNRTFLTQGVAVLILVFGISTLMNAWNLVGIRNRTRGNTSGVVQEQQTNRSELPDNIRTKQVEHDGWQIQDRSIAMPANTPYELTILPSRNGIGCMSSMVIPSAGWRRPQAIRKDVPIVFVGEGLTAGTYPIVCASMGMGMGELVVQ